MALIIILLIVTVANCGLALLVLLHNWRAEVNRVFALTAFSVAGWTLTNGIFQWTSSVSVAMTTATFSYVSALLLAASFLHFSWIFPMRRAISTNVKAFVWSSAVLIGFMSFIPGLVIRSVSIAGNRTIATNNGLYLIALYMVITTVWAFDNLLRQHTRLGGTARAQSRYVLTGAFLTALLGLFFNLLFPILGNYSYVWLGPTASLFFVGFTIYAIVAHHLFDIRIIIKHTLLYGLLLAAISAGYSVLEVLLTDALHHATHDAQNTWLANIGSAAAVSFAVEPLRKWLDDWIDGLVYREERSKRGHANRPRAASAR